MNDVIHMSNFWKENHIGNTIFYIGTFSGNNFSFGTVLGRYQGEILLGKLMIGKFVFGFMK